MTDKTDMSIGVKFCSKCEYNLKCEECVYKGRYDELAMKHDCVLSEVIKMKAELDNARQTMKCIKSENEELKAAGYAVDIKTVRAEAVKEFAERVKRYIDVGHLRPPTEICFSEIAVVETIDNLVKEMVGETDV